MYFSPDVLSSNILSHSLSLCLSFFFYPFFYEAKSHRILMPAFSPKSLSSLVDITLTKTDCLLDRIGSSSQPFEIGHAFTGLTFDIIGNFIGGPGLDFKTTEYVSLF